MKRFLVLYQAPTSAMEQMAKASPEQVKAGMDAWMTWAERAGDALVDLGTPLDNATVLAKGSAAKSSSTVVGYSVLQADSISTITRLLEGHPHLHMPGFAIQVLESLPLPGT